MELIRDFRFEAAHLLPEVADGHKCKRLHGHSYRIRVHVVGRQRPDGMVIDFSDLAYAIEPIRHRLDHRFLNEIEGLENPTSENLAQWIWREIIKSERLTKWVDLSAVEVRETCTSAVVYRGTP